MEKIWRKQGVVIALIGGFTLIIVTAIIALVVISSNKQIIIKERVQESNEKIQESAKNHYIENIDFVEYLGIRKNRTFTYMVYELSMKWTDCQTDSFRMEQSGRLIHIKVLEMEKTPKYSLIKMSGNYFDPTFTRDYTYILLIANAVYEVSEEDYKELKEMEFEKKWAEGWRERLILKRNYKSMTVKFTLPFVEHQQFTKEGEGDSEVPVFVTMDTSSRYLSYNKDKKIYNFYPFYGALSYEEYKFVPYVGFVLFVDHDHHFYNAKAILDDYNGGVEWFTK